MRLSQRPRDRVRRARQSERPAAYPAIRRRDAAERRFHLAFSAPTREAVDRFHQAALAFGGVDQGPPGLRPHYGPAYYAAFVLDAVLEATRAKIAALLGLY